MGRSLRFSEASQKAVGGPFVASSWCLVASLPAKTAPASIDGSPTQRLGAVWGSKMGFKVSRAKENLLMDTYFHVRRGFEAFRERYFKG